MVNKEKKLFEEYKMELIGFESDIIVTSNSHTSDTDNMGEVTDGDMGQDGPDVFD